MAKILALTIGPAIVVVGGSLLIWYLFTHVLASM